MYKMIIIIIFIVLLFMFRLLIKSWTNPGYVMLIYWTIFTILGLLLFEENMYSWSYYGIIWIIIACIIFTIGNILGSFDKKNKHNMMIDLKPYKETLSKISWYFIILCISIGMLRFSLEVIKNGFSLNMFFDIESLMVMNNTMAKERYSGNSSSGALMQIFAIFVYAAPLCGGYSLPYSKNKAEIIISFTTFLPIFSSMMLTSGKAGMLASIFLWISGYIVAYIEKNKKSPKIKIQTAVKSLVSIALLLSMLYGSMILRIGELNRNIINTVNKKFVIYAFGHVPAFDSWFSSYSFGNSDLTLGKYTYIGILNSLNLVEREQGLYHDIVIFSKGGWTNVYTAFRGILTDYGIIGSLFVLLTLGFFSGYLFRKAIKSKASAFEIALLANVYFSIFYSFIVSSLTYSSYILAFVIFYFYLILTKKSNAKMP